MCAFLSFVTIVFVVMLLFYLTLVEVFFLVFSTPSLDLSFYILSNSYRLYYLYKSATPSSVYIVLLIFALLLDTVTLSVIMLICSWHLRLFSEFFKVYSTLFTFLINSASYRLLVRNWYTVLFTAEVL